MNGRERPTKGRWVVTLGLAVIVAVLSACLEPPRFERQIRLVLRHARMPGNADPLPALLREFTARHPGVVVERESLPWTADIQHEFYVINLEARAAGFDVLMLDVIWAAEFARAGWLLDLTDRWRRADRADHFPATVESAMFDGRVWAVPWVANVGLLYYQLGFGAAASTVVFAAGAVTAWAYLKALDGAEVEA